MLLVSLPCVPFLRHDTLVLYHVVGHVVAAWCEGPYRLGPGDRVLGRFMTLSPSCLQGHLDLTVRGWSILIGEPGYVRLLLLAYVGWGMVRDSVDSG